MLQSHGVSVDVGYMGWDAQIDHDPAHRKMSAKEFQDGLQDVLDVDGRSGHFLWRGVGEEAMRKDGEAV